jgi:hypothetical protein
MGFGLWVGDGELGRGLGKNTRPRAEIPNKRREKKRKKLKCEGLKKLTSETESAHP